MAYDLIIENATIITMDAALDRFEGWVGVEGETIAAVEAGTCDQQAARKIDAHGAVVLPGFTDSHLHMLAAGLNYHEANLSACVSIKETLDVMEEACLAEAGVGWVFGFGYLAGNVAEHRYPTKWELDAISHGHKVCVCAATMHGYALNSWGDDVVHIDKTLPGVEVDDEGVSTGVYTSDESALIVSSEVFGDLSDDEILDYLKVTVGKGLEQGATTLHCLMGQTCKGDRDFKTLLEHQDELDADTVAWYQSWDVDACHDLGLERIGGCLTLDGVTFEYTQANYEPFETAPTLRGVLYHTDEEVYRFISRAWELDMQTTMHCVGERAIDQLLYAYKRVIGEQGKKDLRPRIEHFCLCTEKQVALAKELGVTVSMQPGFSYYWSEGFKEVLGAWREPGIEAYARVVDGGVPLLGGSDCPVTPIEPLLQIAALVRNPDPAHSISVDDALRAYTITPAWSAGVEDRKGSLEEGKVADIVMVDKNPYEYADSDELFDMKVLKTIRHGKVVYESDEAGEQA